MFEFNKTFQDLPVNSLCEGCSTWRRSSSSIKLLRPACQIFWPDVLMRRRMNITTTSKGAARDSILFAQIALPRMVLLWFDVWVGHSGPSVHIEDLWFHFFWDLWTFLPGPHSPMLFDMEGSGRISLGLGSWQRILGTSNALASLPPRPCFSWRN